MITAAQGPFIVGTKATTVEQVRARIIDQFGGPIFATTYDDCRNQISWHEPGAVLLFVTVDNGEMAAATRFVQETMLRGSPIAVALAQAGSPTEELSIPETKTFRRIRWPDEVADVVGFFRCNSAEPKKEETLAEVLTSRLATQTPSLLPEVNRLALAATHDVTVLLTGETGTGKTFLAKLLHEHSPRRQNPFLMVPCGAQPSNLFESTFFGHVKGAYTGAHQSRIGRFAAAGRGTILLDEIDALGLEQQASLLRVIETGDYELVGGNETLHSEARIIVASNTDLKDEVAQGTFRQDLFYRLNVMSFHLAPLRRRRQDIPLLARAIVARFNTRFQKRLFAIADDFLARLTEYDWPGNIRQLENVLQEAVLMSTGNDLTLRDLPPLPVSNVEPSCDVVSTDPLPINGNGHTNGNGQPLLNDVLFRGRAAYERELIQKILADCAFNRSRAARRLGISRVTLYKKLRQYSLSNLPER